MDIHEYQAKELLSRLRGRGSARQRRLQPGPGGVRGDRTGRLALGGQGPGAFGRPRQGGRSQAVPHVSRGAARRPRDMLGKRLVTHQTGPEGKICQRVYIEVAEPFERELYLGLVLDRKLQRIRVIASAQGGMEIEEVVKSDPESIRADPGRAGGGHAAVPGARAGVRPRVEHQAGQPRRHHHAGLLSGFSRSGRHHGGDQSAGRDQGQPGAGAGRQDVVRR